MKTLALAIETEPSETLTPYQEVILTERTIDKRLKKVEAIAAYLSSAGHLEKKRSHQKTHAEFGAIRGVALYDGTSMHSVSGEDEEAALAFLSKELHGVDTLAGFDINSFQLPFILKRCMFTKAASDIRERFHTVTGLATATTYDIKQKWMGVNKEYTSLTLADLCRLFGYEEKGVPVTARDRAVATFEIYERMQAYL